MSIKVAINGFGRIGRLSFRKMFNQPNIEIVAINDLTDSTMLAHLLKYDSAQGPWKTTEITAKEKSIVVAGKEIIIFAEKDPNNLPWGKYNVDVVIESTGFFTDKEKALAHVKAGAKKVVISAPATGDLKTIVFNVNHHILDGSETVLSCASCTTNCLAPMANAINKEFGVEVGLITTVHAYTNDQSTLDAPHPKGDLRRARAAAASIVPNSTGAAKAIGLVLPELNKLLDGAAQRVPTITGSLTELTTVLKKKVSIKEVNDAVKKYQTESFGYTEDHIVSSDIIGMSFGSLFDGSQTQVISNGDHQLVKTVAWYDNEMSYVSQLVRTVEYIATM